MKQSEMKERIEFLLRQVAMLQEQLKTLTEEFKRHKTLP